jgi:hypothetical protein
MKNLLSFNQGKSQIHQVTPLDPVKPNNYLVDDDNPASHLTQGWYSQFEDWVLLELTSDHTKPHIHRTKPRAHVTTYRLELDDDSPATTLTQGWYSQFEDWVALELTAEQMLKNEVSTVTTYAAGDAHNMWEAIKDSLLPYELAAGQFLLKAADPTQVEWLQGHWWDSEDPAMH